MKQIQNLKAIVLGTAISLVSLVSNAGETPKNTSELIYVGMVNNKPSFRLVVNNDKEDQFIISVADKTEGLLYTQKIRAKSSATLFQLDNWDQGSGILQVEVKNTGTRQTEVFTINIGSRSVVETKVEKL